VPVSRAGIDEFSYAQIRAALRLGLLTRIRRGVLAPAAADPAETYLLVARSAEEDEAAAQALARRARALLRPLPPETRISHESAAILRRLWLPCLPDGDLHVTIPGQSERRDGGIHIHGTSAAAEVEYVEGLPVVTLPRAAVDVARGHLATAAVVPLDHAARMLIARAAGDSTPLWEAVHDPALRDAVHDPALRAGALAELHRAWQASFGWPGTRVVRELLADVEPASESPYESISRIQLADRHLPAPLVGVRVEGASGRTYWADFLWPAARLIGEADGDQVRHHRAEPRAGLEAHGDARRTSRPRLRRDPVAAGDAWDTVARGSGSTSMLASRPLSRPGTTTAVTRDNKGGNA
jgi:hypothetical protein